jgi:PAS domain S-box-containing protein
MGADDIGRTAVTPHATTPHVATPQSTSLQATEIDHLRNDADLLRVIVDHTVDAIVRFDRSLRYDFVNDRSVQLTGVPRHRFLGATQADLGYPPDEVAIREERITKVFDSGEASSYHDVITNLEGERWYETTLLPQLDHRGEVAHVIVMSRDVTSRKLAEDALVRAAARDPLTGLANRTALLEVLQQAIGAAEESLLTTAVLLIDLDRFKLVNDSLGHAVGDRLLCNSPPSGWLSCVRPARPGRPPRRRRVRRRHARPQRPRRRRSTRP